MENPAVTLARAERAAETLRQRVLERWVLVIATGLYLGVVGLTVARYVL